MPIYEGTRRVNRLFYKPPGRPPTEDPTEMAAAYAGSRRVFARTGLPVIATFTVAPARVRTDQGTIPRNLLLSWGVTDATSISIEARLADGTTADVPVVPGGNNVTTPTPGQDATYVLTATNAGGSTEATAAFSRVTAPRIGYFRERAGSHLFQSGPFGGFYERRTLEWSVSGKPFPRLSIDHGLSEHVGDPNRATHNGVGSAIVQRTIAVGDEAVSEVFTLRADNGVGPAVTATYTANWSAGVG